MKKIITLIGILIFSIILISCDLEPINLGDENLDIVEEVGYTEFLNDSNPVITITVKEIGEIKLQLFPEVAKLTVDNFLTYVLSESFTNSTFHRIIKGFMIQGGIVENELDPIVGEFESNDIINPISHTVGVISMARTVIPNSATSQFFIVHKNSVYLDGEYAAFGGLVSGLDVLNTIANTKTDYNYLPINEVVIESITVELNGYILE